MLLPWPPPVFREVGAGGEVGRCEAAYGQIGVRSRHWIRLADAWIARPPFYVKRRRRLVDGSRGGCTLRVKGREPGHEEAGAGRDDRPGVRAGSVVSRETRCLVTGAPASGRGSNRAY
ncbi:hypothetical protein GCM10010353_57400 [Streptomyces chryseus]|nr:hypothetical protein GCM10010353_57400 [Streptomyces chryseus]